MLSNVIARWPDIERLKRGEKVAPMFVDFHTSDACNHNCNGCAYRGKHTGSILDRDKHFAAVITLLKAGVKAFDFAGGGEPTMLPYLSELMRMIAWNGAYFGLITNGSMLNPDLVDTMLDHGTYLRISFEASNPFQFGRYKGVPVTEFSRILARVKEIVQERDQRGSDLEISLKFSVGNSLRGYQHYYLMFNIAEMLGVDRISVKCLRHEPEELSEQERYAEYALFNKARPTNHRYKIIESILPYPQDKVPQCWLNPLHTVMDQDGNLYACCYHYYRKDSLLIGNIFEKSFDEIWFSDHHRHVMRNIKRDECKIVDCKFFNHHEAVVSSAKRGQVYFL